METIDGAWIMKGCRRTDKDCLHSPEDLLELVLKVGFFEVMDLVLNTLGGFVGALISVGLRKAVGVIDFRP